MQLIIIDKNNKNLFICREIGSNKKRIEIEGEPVTVTIIEDIYTAERNVSQVNRILHSHWLKLIWDKSILFSHWLKLFWNKSFLYSHWLKLFGDKHIRLSQWLKFTLR